MMRLMTLALTAGLLLMSFTACHHTEVKIGAILPITGAQALYGQAVKEGMEVAEAVIKQSKQFSYTLMVDYRDSQSSPDMAAQLAETSIRDGAVGLIGGVTSQEAFAIAEVAGKRSRVLVSPTASAPELAGINAYFFRIYPSDQLEVLRMARFIAKEKSKNKVALFYAPNAYGKGLKDSLDRELHRFGVIDVFPIELQEGSSDFSEAVGEGLAQKPDAVFVAAYADEIIEIIRILKKVKFDGLITTCSAINAPGVFARAGDVMEGVYYCRPPEQLNNPKNTLAQTFVRLYKEKYGKAPDIFAAYGFDALYVVALAIKAQGNYPEDIYKGLKGINEHLGVTGLITFTNLGEVNNYPKIYWVKDGKEQDYIKWREERKRELIEKMREIKSGARKSD